MSATLLLLPAPDAAPRRTDQAQVFDLATAWPTARPVVLPRMLPDGSGYEPRMVVDAGTSLGLHTSADGTRADLVVFTASTPDRPRLLMAGGTGVVIDALTATADRVYWLASQPDADGVARPTLWAADLDGGDPVALTADTGAVVASSSQYDLQVAEGRVIWVAYAGVSPVTTQLRTIAERGGPVSVTDLAGRYTPTAWPWLVADPGQIGAPWQLMNASTGQRQTITAAREERITCSPVWCRVVSYDQPTETVTLVRPDGTGRRRITADGSEPATMDVALLDRFEVLAASLGGSGSTTVETLTLADLRTGRLVRIAVVTSRAARDGWLWWAAGDESDQRWYLLDLTTLP